ncbi:MAG TPA: flagellar type III secretion system protein FlhB [Roseateles sp.]|uniref:flagellar type III secretion system protein FlhB n=1 Tax=Roseateles sp. TaxID=1971397 RepID=UPI002ED93686
MSDNTSGDKTEKASDQKLRKAREKGQVPRSRDLSMAVGVLLGFKLITLLMPLYLEDFRQLFTLGFALLEADGAQDNVWSASFLHVMSLLAKICLPLLVLPAVALLASVMPGGLVFSTSRWMPDFSRMSPISNLGRLFSAKHYSELGISIAKVACVLALLVHMSRSLGPSFLELQGQSLDQALLNGTGLMLDALLSLAGVLLLFALIDAPLQHFFFMRGQRMSKQEVKDEHKQQEGSPEVRQRIRQLQRAMAQRAVRKTVPQADVVIVNPEHYAVALRYDDERAEAPFVLAKGVDEMALYIREIARQHGVQTLSLPPLARALYNSSQVQQQIPASLYQAVAQVLSYVMQLKAFQTGKRRSAPPPPTDLPVPSHLSDPQTP